MQAQAKPYHLAPRSSVRISLARKTEKAAASIDNPHRDQLPPANMLNAAPVLCTSFQDRNGNTSTSTP